jgi:hypothetical protein
MEKVAAGSIWVGSNSREKFVVITVSEVDGHTWVHYRTEKTNKEYSCYIESFLQRFTEHVN